MSARNAALDAWVKNRLTELGEAPLSEKAKIGDIARANTEGRAKEVAESGLDKWVNRKIGKSGTARDAEDGKAWTVAENHLKKYANDSTMQMNAAAYGRRADSRQGSAMTAHAKVLDPKFNDVLTPSLTSEGKLKTEPISDAEKKTRLQQGHAAAAKKFKQAEKDHIQAAGAYRAAWADHLAQQASHEAHFGEGDHFAAMKLHNLAAMATSHLTSAEADLRTDWNKARMDWYEKNKDAKGDQLVDAAAGVGKPPILKDASKRLEEIRKEKSALHTAYANDHAALAGSGAGAGENVGMSEKPFPAHLMNKAYFKDGSSEQEAKYAQAKIDTHLREAAICRAMGEAHAKEAKKENPAASSKEWDDAKHPRDERGRWTSR